MNIMCVYVDACVRVRVCEHSQEVASACAYFFRKQKFDD